MKNLNLKFILIALLAAPLAIQAQNAPWGINQLNFGPQFSWSNQSENWTSNGNQLYIRHKNVGMGINGRAQFSFLDLLLFGEDNALSDSKLRIVDVIGLDAGLGYLKDGASVYDNLSKFERVNNTLWYNIGVDFGLQAMYRFIPKLDLGVKFTYVTHVNATFGATSYVRYDNGSLVDGNSGRSQNAYGNKFSWGGIGRYGRFYGEFLIIKGRPNEINMNIFELKYCFGDLNSGKTWHPYVGIQIGIGKTLSDANYNGSSGNQYGATNRFTSNWIQLMIGKMSN